MFKKLMIKKVNKLILEIVKEILENDNREKEVIVILLDKYIGKDNRLLV